MATLTLGFLKDQVLSRLENNDQMFQSDELTDAINEAICISNMLCGWYQSTIPISTLTTIADRHIYDTPNGIIFPIRVTFEDQVLEVSNLFAIINDWPSFLRDTTSNTGNQVSRWVPLGLTKFAIHPADSVGGGSLMVTGISEPDTLTDDEDQIHIPKEGITTVCDYAAHIVQCKLQGTPFMQSLGMFRNFQALIGLGKYWNTYRQPNMYFDEQKPTRE